MIRCYVLDNIKTWDKDLSIITMAMHSMVNKSTGFSANQIMLGREVLQPVDIMLGTIQHKFKSVSTNEWVDDLVERMSKVHHQVREKLKSVQAYQKRTYDLKLNENIYQAGDLVYQLEKTSKRGLSPKLQPVWKGPFLVLQAKHPLYEIKNT